MGVGQPERDKRRWELVRWPGTSNPTNQVNHPPGCGPSRPKSLHRLHAHLHGSRETPTEGTETKRDRKMEVVAHTCNLNTEAKAGRLPLVRDQPGLQRLSLSGKKESENRMLG